MKEKLYNPIFGKVRVFIFKTTRRNFHFDHKFSAYTGYFSLSKRIRVKRVSTLPMAVMNSFLFCATLPTFEKFIAVFSLPTINSCLICIFVEVVYAFWKAGSASSTAIF